MTCKLLAPATVAFHLAWSTLTLLGIESASAQTTPSRSPSPSTTPTPTPESTPSLATLGSGPDDVITYEGELVEFTRYQSGDWYVVEIPEAHRSRLIRGDLSACASKNGVTVWSFPNRLGRQAILHHAAGRIEITFAEDLQFFSSEAGPHDRTRPESIPTPKPSPEPTQEKLHGLQKELIKRIKNISDQQATDILEQFAPPGFSTLPEPKIRLQVLISDTLDLAKLTRMGEKFPLLPTEPIIPLLPTEPTTRDVHGLQKLLIKGLGKISDQDATNILDQFAPPAFSKAGTPKIRLQVLISNMSDFVTLSKMGEKIPH
jgi:hypothetical protein